VGEAERAVYFTTEGRLQMPKDVKAASTAAKPRRTVRRKKVTVTADDIAVRAYFLWETGSPGGELEHWLQAERELVAA
jgi:Protein of unknown function (DUF2934)